jgi:uncharacterized protein YndB with AHSA1/START domain
MVRQSPSTRPSTLEHPRASAVRKSAAPLLAGVRCDTARGRTTVVIPREFAHSAADVWSLLTIPDLLGAWAPYTADRDLLSVGRATLTMLDGENASQGELASVIFTADAQRTLEYSWGEDTVTWTIKEVDAPQNSAAHTRLTLRQTLANPAMASAIAAGWHLCLDVAAGVLDGHPQRAVRGMDAMEYGWADLNRRYATKLGIEPTRIG